MKKSALLICLVVLLAGCNGNLQISNYSLEEKSALELAVNYFDNIVRKSNITNERSIDSDCFPDELYEVEIYDDSGNVILFDELSYEQKCDFYKIWRNDGIKELEKKLISDDSFKDMLAIETQAFNMTIESSERSIFKVSLDNFVNQYEKNLERLQKNNISASRGSSKECTSISDGNLVEKSLDTFEANYKQGRILINTCSRQETSFGYIGHSSMMSEKELNENWRENKNNRATITSFPNDKGTRWDGMTDGVQKEPIGYWCGDNAAQNVSILDVRSKKWKWFKTYYTNASDEDHKKAVEYAEKQIGKPYNKNLVLFGMWSTNSFYCSSLVYKSWYEVNSKYDLKTNIMWVAPSDLYASDRTYLIKSYSNY